MKYFKTTAFLLSVFILSISCSQRDSFNSLLDGENEQVLSSENPEHKSEIKNLVNQRQIVKIGDKKKKRSVNLSETVGQNNLKNEANRETASAVKDEKVVTIEVGVKGSEKEMEYTKNLSLLFYIDNKKSFCLRQFRKYGQNFLNYLNKAPHWDMAFSFHRDNKELIELEMAKGHILSKNTKPSKALLFEPTLTHVFKATLDAHYNNSNGDSLSYLEERKLNAGPGYLNPLKGLDQTLEVFSSNEEGHKVVLYFDEDFPYYSSKDWKELYNKHKNLTILLISQRNANVSNINTAFNANLDIAPVFGCNLNTTKLVEETLKQILVRVK